MRKLSCPSFQLKSLTHLQPSHELGCLFFLHTSPLLTHTLQNILHCHWHILGIAIQEEKTVFVKNNSCILENVTGCGREKSTYLQKGNMFLVSKHKTRLPREWNLNQQSSPNIQGLQASFGWWASILTDQQFHLQRPCLSIKEWIR